MVKIISTKDLDDNFDFIESDYSANDESSDQHFEEYLDSVTPEKRNRQPCIKTPFDK